MDLPRNQCPGLRLCRHEHGIYHGTLCFYVLNSGYHHEDVSIYDIVIGKFFAAWSISIIAILPTSIYYFSLSQLANPVGNIDTAGVIGSYIGLLILAAVFTAIGLLASSLTRNQVVSFVLAAFLSFLLFTGLNSLANIDVWSALSPLLSYLSIEQHYNAMSRGVLDSRDLIYLVTLIGLLLFFTSTILIRKK